MHAKPNVHETVVIDFIYLSVYDQTIFLVYLQPRLQEAMHQISITENIIEYILSKHQMQK